MLPSVWEVLSFISQPLLFTAGFFFQKKLVYERVYIVCEYWYFGWGDILSYVSYLIETSQGLSVILRAIESLANIDIPALGSEQLDEKV